MLRLKTPEDIEKLPHYVGKVDPEVTPLSRIVQHYYIRPFEIRCALCGTSHMEGCIVELHGGEITNIGHVCGSRFGEKFEQERKKNYENVYRPRLVQAVAQAQERVASTELTLQGMRHAASDILRRASNFTQKFPDVYSTLRRRAIESQADLYESVERTKEEIDDILAANRFQSRDSVRLVEKLRGTVAGFRFPGINWSFQSGVRQILSEVDRFLNLKPRSLAMADLQYWSHWFDDYDDKFAALQTAIADGERFFSPTNFLLFALLPTSNDAKRKLLTLQVSDINLAPRMESSEDSNPVRGRSVRQAPRPRQASMSIKEIRRLTGNKKMR